MWHVDSFGHPTFASAAWHNNKVYGGANLPAVAALKTEWRERPFERKRGEPPEPEPPPDNFTQIVRNAAWNAGGIPYNPEAAFPKYAREHDLGNPETREFDFTYNRINYRGQGFSKGIVYAKVGAWGDIREVAW